MYFEMSFTSQQKASPNLKYIECIKLPIVLWKVFTNIVTSPS